MTIKERTLFCCVFCNSNLWALIGALKPVKLRTNYNRLWNDSAADYRLAEPLDEISLVEAVTERLNGSLKPDSLWRMAKAAPYCQKIRILCPNGANPTIHPEDLEDWLNQAFPELSAGKVSA